MGTKVDSGAPAAAGLMKLLGDRTRLRILLRLSHGEANVQGLCDRLALDQPTVSHHLGILRMAGAVATRREGKKVFYRLSGPPPVPGVIRAAAGGVTVVASPR
jgi:DNA-binding transcriptional ArsR family regulator